MNFISVLFPAVIIAFGCLVCISAFSTFDRGTSPFRMMMAASACLCLAGIWLEFFVSQVSAAELVLRAMVVAVSVTGVVAVSVAKDYDADYDYYSSEVNVCQTVFRAKYIGTACAVMTLVLASIAAGI